jgi:uncharacterized protein
VTGATTTLSRSEIDAILDAHFRAEMAGDVEATLATLTADVEHDVVGDPAGVLYGPEAVGGRYGHLFSNVRGGGHQVSRRLYGENFVVDDKIWTARVDGEFLGLPGRGRTINVRILHVFEFADGAITRENVWIDGAAAIAQLTATTPE